MKSILTPRFWLSCVLVLSGVALRVIPHPWNFAPIGAIALFAGAHFERRSLGVAMPLLAMFAADTMLELFTDQGYHVLMPPIYATYALIAVIGMKVREHRTSVIAVGSAVVTSSVVFYLVTNFAVWVTFSTYPKTIDGLVACYIAAIPYFGHTLASDALFTAILFGTFAVVERRVPLFAPARG